MSPRSDVVNVPGFGNMASYHEHEVAHRQTLGIRDAVVKYRQGESQTVFWLDPDKTKDLSPLQKLVLADGQPSPFGGVVAGNVVTVYRD